jgi:proteasome lid subunit RPN8/RPN11
MGVVIDPAAAEEMLRRAQEGYPNEVCGVLVGRAEKGEIRVRAARPAPNVTRGSRRSGFEIAASDLMQIMEDASAKEEDVVGFYHSHPDQPAAPSQADQDTAWPDYVYVIVSVVQKRDGHLAAWRLSTDRSRFIQERVASTPRRAAAAKGR